MLNGIDKNRGVKLQTNFFEQHTCSGMSATSLASLKSRFHTQPDRDVQMGSAFADYIGREKNRQRID